VKARVPGAAAPGTSLNLHNVLKTMLEMLKTPFAKANLAQKTLHNRKLFGRARGNNLGLDFTYVLNYNIQADN
jgi:hypothetical protein